MSVIAYGLITQRREKRDTAQVTLPLPTDPEERNILVRGLMESDTDMTVTDDSTVTYKPSSKLPTFVDALLALVPAEFIAAHTAIIAFTTETTYATDGVTTSTITDDGTLSITFWLLPIVAVVVYAIVHGKAEFGRWDFVRMLIPGAAMVGWMMGLSPSAFDAWNPDFDSGNRQLIVIVGAIVLGAIAARLGYVAEKEDPKES